MRAQANKVMAPIAEEARKFNVTHSVIGCILLWTAMGLLYQGIVGELLHYRVNYDISWLGRTLKVKDETRSLWGDADKSIISALYNHNAVWAANMLIFFGVVIPAMKIISFHLWLLAPEGTMTSRLAEKGVASLGGVSRWVAVDAVVEAFFVGMLLKIPSVQADHRAGFLCFVGYCILSATAFILVSPDKTPAPSRTQLALGRPLSKFPVLLFVTLLAFLTLLYIGSSEPVIRILIPETVIRSAAMDEIERSDTFKKQDNSKTFTALRSHLINEIAEKVKIDEDVSIGGCVRRLMNSGIPYTVIGSGVLFFCVLVVPLLDALLGTAGAFGAKTNKLRGLLHHFAMLDVMIVGMILSVITSKCEPDIKAAMLPGFLYLIFACLAWYLHSSLCDAAIAAIDESKVSQPLAEEEEALLEA